jgi:hypothetical protein
VHRQQAGDEAVVLEEGLRPPVARQGGSVDALAAVRHRPAEHLVGQGLAHTDLPGPGLDEEDVDDRHGRLGVVTEVGGDEADDHLVDQPDGDVPPGVGESERGGGRRREGRSEEQAAALLTDLGPELGPQDLDVLEITGAGRSGRLHARG